MSMLLRQYHKKPKQAEPVEESAAPAQSASKAKWVEYAEAQGHTDVEGLTKADIQALFETEEPEGEPEEPDPGDENADDDEDTPEEETSGDDE